MEKSLAEMNGRIIRLTAQEEGPYLHFSISGNGKLKVTATYDEKGQKKLPQYVLAKGRTLFEFEFDAARGRLICSIGRDPTNTIVVPPTLRYTSVKHLQIQVRGDKVILSDLNSSNGTFLKTKPTVPLQGAPRDTKSGDEAGQISILQCAAAQVLENEFWARQVQGLPPKAAILPRIAPATAQEAADCQALVESNIGLEPLMTIKELMARLSQSNIAHNIVKKGETLVIFLPANIRIPGREDISSLEVALDPKQSQDRETSQFQKCFNLLGTTRDTAKNKATLLAEVCRLLPLGMLKVENLLGFPIGIRTRAARILFAGSIGMDPNQISSEEELMEFQARRNAATEQLRDKKQRRKHEDGIKQLAEELFGPAQTIAAELHERLNTLAGSSVPPNTEDLKVLRREIIKLLGSEYLEGLARQSLLPDGRPGEALNRCKAQLTDDKNRLIRKIEGLAASDAERREAADFLTKTIEVIKEKDWKVLMELKMPEDFRRRLLDEEKKLNDHITGLLNNVILAISASLNSKDAPQDNAARKNLLSMQVMAVAALASRQGLSPQAAETFARDPMAAQGDVWKLLGDIRHRAVIDVMHGRPRKTPDVDIPWPAETLPEDGRLSEVMRQCWGTGHYFGAFTALQMLSPKERFLEPSTFGAVQDSYAALLSSMLSRFGKKIPPALELMRSLAVMRDLIGETPPEIKAQMLLGGEASIPATLNLNVIIVTIFNYTIAHFGFKDVSRLYTDAAIATANALAEKYPDYKEWAPRLPSPGRGRFLGMLVKMDPALDKHIACVSAADTAMRNGQLDEAEGLAEMALAGHPEKDILPLAGISGVDAGTLHILANNIKNSALEMRYVWKRLFLVCQEEDLVNTAIITDELSQMYRRFSGRQREAVCSWLKNEYVPSLARFSDVWAHPDEARPEQAKAYAALFPCNIITSRPSSKLEKYEAEVLDLLFKQVGPGMVTKVSLLVTNKFEEFCKGFPMADILQEARAHIAGNRSGELVSLMSDFANVRGLLGMWEKQEPELFTTALRLLISEYKGESGPRVEFIMLLYFHDRLDFLEEFVSKPAAQSQAGRDLLGFIRMIRGREAEAPRATNSGKALRRTLLFLAAREELETVAIAVDTEVVPANVAQAAERLTKRFGVNIIHIRGTGKGLAEDIRAKGLNSDKVVIIAGDRTVDEVQGLGRILHIQNPEDNYLPILELYSAALQILYGMGDDRILASLRSIDDKLGIEDLRKLLSEGIIRILPKTHKMDPAERIESYNAARHALESL